MKIRAVKYKQKTLEKEILKPVVGTHVFGNLYGVDAELLKDPVLAKEIVFNAAEKGNLHIIDILEKQFNIIDSPDAGGISIIALLIESHIALHTWPESNYVTIDIYSCGESSKPQEAFDYIVSKFKPVDLEKFETKR
ncbi:MAG: adenosylmethionine decarboxylase [Candidatus Parvarchaeota archaeon]|nr:adenosylmethionine decarboxylase [Candidatus Parvarchaeota archaeon]